MTRPSDNFVWLLRLVWLLQPLGFVAVLNEGTGHLSSAARVFIASIAWAVWATVLLATFVPSTISITVGRMIAPTLIVVVVICATTGIAGWKLATGLGASVLAILVWFSGETGVALAQGSAYGSEQRFPLKPPVPLFVPMLVSWLVSTASAVAAVILIANGVWPAGVGLAIIAGLTLFFVGPRFHQLARRWLVVVPVGLVVHDPMMLTENALFRSAQIAALRLAPADTEAADLTGGTAGVAIEIVLHNMDTIIKTGGRENPTGTALHVLSILVSPTRPGKALQAAAARRMPVG